MAHKLTDSFVKSLPVPEKGSTVYRDSEFRGFLVRVYPSGRRAFFLSYWPAPKAERRVPIGDYGAGLKVPAARKLAQKMKWEIQHGGADPAAECRKRREAPTVAQLCERYLEEHARQHKRPKSVEEDESMIRVFVRPLLGETTRVADVTHEDIDRLRYRIANRKVAREAEKRGNGPRTRTFGGPTRANRVLALLSKMFGLAIRWGWRADNPAKGVERAAEERRERYLADAEMSRLLEALADHPDRTSARALLFLLLTGARKGEALSATWDQFDLETGVWTRPSAHTKQKKVHRVPLSGTALDLLNEMREEADQKLSESSVRPISDPGHVFPGRIPGRPLGSLRGTWRAVCERAGIEDCRIHDLRHSFASALASHGLDIKVLGNLLGHTQIATTMRYSHLYDEALREGAELMGQVVRRASDRIEAEVVSINSGDE